MVVNSTPGKVSRLYFEWLCHIVDVKDGYWSVMGYLYNHEFTWFIANDDNRINDGIALRDKFLEESGLEADIYGPCSVLEMMVALAMRMETDILYDPEKGDQTSEWFWLMIRNLGLDRYSDENLDFETAGEIDNIIRVMVDRVYAMNGTGGLFPLKKPKQNQRRVEIWYQMQHYICENFIL